MKLYLLNRFVFLFLLSFHAHSEVFTFVVADDEPPYSSISEGVAVGIIPDIINLVFNYLPSHQLKLEAFPWARAQVEVKLSRADGFFTYPSLSRKDYAIFTSNTAYTEDYGYLIYSLDNINRGVIESAASFEGLKSVKVITKTGAEWVSDNIPEYIQKVKTIKSDIMFHLLFLRKQGDFIIMPPEEASYKAKVLGYQDKLAYRQVNFINDALIPFHIGIRKSHPLAKDFISEVDAVLGNDQFLKEVKKIQSSYR